MEILTGYFVAHIGFTDSAIAKAYFTPVTSLAALVQSTDEAV